MITSYWLDPTTLARAASSGRFTCVSASSAPSSPLGCTLGISRLRTSPSSRSGAGRLHGRGTGAFPDEIDVGLPETLTIRLEGTIDRDDPSAVHVERRFPLAGHVHGISRVQLDAIGWDYVATTRSLFRELGGTSAGVARDLLWGLDLSEDAVAFDAARESYRTAT